MFYLELHNLLTSVRAFRELGRDSQRCLHRSQGWTLLFIFSKLLLQGKPSLVYEVFSSSPPVSFGERNLQVILNPSTSPTLAHSSMRSAFISGVSVGISPNPERANSAPAVSESSSAHSGSPPSTPLTSYESTHQHPQSRTAHLADTCLDSCLRMC